MELRAVELPAVTQDDQVDALAPIGQMLDRMGKVTAASSIDEKIRFMNEMTMDEDWVHTQPRRPDLDRRT